MCVITTYTVTCIQSSVYHCFVHSHTWAYRFWWWIHVWVVWFLYSTSCVYIIGLKVAVFSYWMYMYLAWPDICLMYSRVFDSCFFFYIFCPLEIQWSSSPENTSSSIHCHLNVVMYAGAFSASVHHAILTSFSMCSCKHLNTSQSWTQFCLECTQLHTTLIL